MMGSECQQVAVGSGFRFGSRAAPLGGLLRVLRLADGANDRQPMPPGRAPWCAIEAGTPSLAHGVEQPPVVAFLDQVSTWTPSVQ
jgi:hypothetical protein